ncbi:gene transfer agent family protein [Gymnodinialimonas hymeniacidonis]|uniref:gene transfer agent family protein n=1 Tax=Gymnodinialimonas hymeniacidonis TaxID=3126508 RepID=UPI0034C647C1
MANPWTGEVALVLNGERHEAKLTLGALAELEDRMGAGSLTEMVSRFEGDGLKSSDVLALICAGLRGGGWRGDMIDLLHAEIEGGLIEAAAIAARLLVLAFQPAPE